MWTWRQIWAFNQNNIYDIICSGAARKRTVEEELAFSPRWTTSCCKKNVLFSDIFTRLSIFQVFYSSEKKKKLVTLAEQFGFSPRNRDKQLDEVVRGFDSAVDCIIKCLNRTSFWLKTYCNVKCFQSNLCVIQMISGLLVSMETAHVVLFCYRAWRHLSPPPNRRSFLRRRLWMMQTGWDTSSAFWNGSHTVYVGVFWSR